MYNDELCFRRFINEEFNTKNIRMNIMKIRSHYVSVLVDICFVWMITIIPIIPQNCQISPKSLLLLVTKYSKQIRSL